MEVKLELQHKDKVIYSLYAFQTLKKFIIWGSGFVVAPFLPITCIFLKFFINSDKTKGIKRAAFITNKLFYDDKEKNKLNGSNKVTQGLIEDFTDRNWQVVIIPMSQSLFVSIYMIVRKKQFLLHLLSSRQIIVSMPGASGIHMAYLRLMCGGNVVFIAHNPEYFHRLDWLRNTKPISRKLKHFVKLIKGTFGDILAVNLSSKLLVLGESELEIYWKRLNVFRRNEKIKYLPYVPPKYFQKNCKQILQNKKEVWIVGSFADYVGENRTTTAFFQNGYRINKMFEMHNLNLISVGNGVDFPFAKSRGFISNKRYLDLQHNVLGIVIPMDWGWGFKTKIGDSLFMNQRIFVDAKTAKKILSLSDSVTVVKDWSKFKYINESSALTRKREKLKNRIITQRQRLIDEIAF